MPISAFLRHFQYFKFHCFLCQFLHVFFSSHLHCYCYLRVFFLFIYPSFYSLFIADNVLFIELYNKLVSLSLLRLFVRQSSNSYQLGWQMTWCPLRLSYPKGVSRSLLQEFVLLVQPRSVSTLLDRLDRDGRSTEHPPPYCSHRSRR